MPKLTLMLDRKPVQVYDLDQTVVRIGRGQGMDILIDNVSVSRRQAEIRKEGEAWVVRDLGSSNGTFVNGERVMADHTLRPGDEISFGKFSLFFERVVTEPVARETPVAAAAPRQSPSPSAKTEGTLHMSVAEVERLQKVAAQKRQAQLQWEAAGERGTHYLEGGSVIVGRTDLCDVRLPSGGPKQHIVVLHGKEGYEVRNVSSWYRMRVNGRLTARARLKSGDLIQVGPVRLTFMDEVR
jgi:pSer/pThr/pTyr-binding forkhead associated (FHA) protein